MATHLAVAIGDVDGDNVDFATPTAYESGSLQVTVDDVPIDASDVTQSSPTTFRLADAPATDSIVRVAYTDPVTDATGNPLTPSGVYAELLDRLYIEGGQDLEIFAGQSGLLFYFIVFDPNGSRVDLTDHILYFQAREDSEAGAAVFDKTSLGVDPDLIVREQGAEATRGYFDVRFTDDETIDASGKITTYDVWVRTPEDALIPLLEGARLTVRAAVRRAFPTS